MHRALQHPDPSAGVCGHPPHLLCPRLAPTRCCTGRGGHQHLLVHLHHPHLPAPGVRLHHRAHVLYLHPARELHHPAARRHGERQQRRAQRGDHPQPLRHHHVVVGQRRLAPLQTHLSSPHQLSPLCRLLLHLHVPRNLDPDVVPLQHRPHVQPASEVHRGLRPLVCHRHHLLPVVPHLLHVRRPNLRDHVDDHLVPLVHYLRHPTTPLPVPLPRRARLRTPEVLPLPQPHRLPHPALQLVHSGGQQVRPLTAPSPSPAPRGRAQHLHSLAQRRPLCCSAGEDHRPLPLPLRPHRLPAPLRSARGPERPGDVDHPHTRDARPWQPPQRRGGYRLHRGHRVLPPGVPQQRHLDSLRGSHSKRRGKRHPHRLLLRLPVPLPLALLLRSRLRNPRSLHLEHPTPCLPQLPVLVPQPRGWAAERPDHHGNTLLVEGKGRVCRHHVLELLEHRIPHTVLHRVHGGPPQG
eukprot:Sspe_Gene.10725::Locus_3591_Transcript_3_3_Confidence_0.500_Length_5983::g.10725::m.10725